MDTANGPDNLSNIFIKKTKNNLYSAYIYIFNYSFIHGVYPLKWKESYWTPLHKKGSKYLRENYRPISLLSNVGKLIDKIVFKNLYVYCDKNNYLNKYNYGFKQKMSCQHNLSMLLHNTYKILDKGNEALILFFDVVKAFDKVDHLILLKKLYILGIRNVEHYWFKNYLTKRFSSVIINNCKSEKYPILSSVTQGSVLATLLWSIYTYDITEDIYTIPSIFADDTALITELDTDINYSFNWMQNDIDTLQNWANENKLTFNAQKSVYMIISKKHKCNDYYPKLHLYGIELKRVRTQKQLGIYIDELLTWTDHINYIQNKTYKVLRMLKHIRKLITFDIAEKIYKTIIKSIIDYGCMFYSNTNISNLDKIEKNYYHSALICTQAYQHTSRIKLLQEINWETFTQRTYYLGITMFAKIKFTKIPKIIYDEFPFSTTLRHSDRYKNNLAHLISKRNYFYNSYFVKMFREWNKLSKEIKQSKDYDEFITLINIHKNKEINYYSYESYVDKINLSFRMKNSLLQGDKYKMGYSDINKCLNCPTQQQETLYHYIFVCPKYNYMRHKMLKQIKTIAKIKNFTNMKILLLILNKLLLILNNNKNGYLQKHEYIYIINKFKEYITKTKRF